MAKMICPCCQHQFEPPKIIKRATVSSVPDPARKGWHLWPEVLCSDGKMRAFGSSFPTPKNFKSPKHIKPHGFDWLPSYMAGVSKAKELMALADAPYPVGCSKEALAQWEDATHKARNRLITHTRKVFMKTKKVG